MPFSALYMTDGDQRYLCSESVDLKSMQVDHMIPEHLLDLPTELVAACNRLRQRVAAQQRSMRHRVVPRWNQPGLSNKYYSHKHVDTDRTPCDGLRL